MIHLCFSLYDSDDIYSKHTGIAIFSVIKTTQKKLCIHLLHDTKISKCNIEKFRDVVNQYQHKIIFYPIDSIQWEKYREMAGYCSLGTFFRLHILDIIPQDIERLIYLDSDILVNLDINDLWQEKLGDKCVGARYFANESFWMVKNGLVEQNKIPSSFMRLWSREVNKCVKEFKNAGNKIDIIQYANYMGLGLDRLDDVPTVVRISSFQPLMRAAAKLKFDLNLDYKNERAADFLETLTVIKADAVYSPSQLMTIPFETETGRPIRVIESPFYPVRSDTVFKSELLQGKKYILTFSTLNLLKGIKLIGDSIWKILKKHKEVYWVFAGAEVMWTDDDGVQTLPSEYILKKAGEFADRLLFLGKVKHEVLMQIVKAAEVCVMPSRIDNLPNTCIEAMALGKVVIGTKGASFEQLIDDGESGFLIEREKNDDLIQTVNKALSIDQLERNRIGENAKARIKYMDPKLIKKQLLTLYKETIKNFDGSPQYALNLNYEKVCHSYNMLMKDNHFENMVIE